MEDSILVTLGVVFGVSLLYFGSRLRSRARRRPLPPKAPDGGGGS
jgi:hypothetical protein